MSISESIYTTAQHGVGSAEVSKAMKLYEGRREKDRVMVTVNGKPIDARFDLWPFDFNGFEWGYECSGAMQLSLALLSDYLHDDRQASSLCQAFAHEIIAKLPYEGWQLSDKQIRNALHFQKVM